VVTATPLLLYGQAVKWIPFSTVGFFQYIAPTITLILGVLLFNEPFTMEDFTVFLFIWLALAVYLGSSLMNIWKGRKQNKDGKNRG
jgi:chloramphenicol-sensitive protein RarD